MAVSDHEGQQQAQAEASSPVVALLNHPVLHTLTVMATVSIVGWGIDPQSADSVLRLGATTPLSSEWWTLLTAIYAHFDAAHLISNAVIVVVAGGVASVWMGWLRFHLFFIVAGVFTTAAQLLVIDQFSHSVPHILGASGSAFALLGYVIGTVATNILSGRSPGAAVGVVGLLVLVGGVVTVYLTPQGTAILSHFVGVLFGLVAGWFRLFHANLRGE